MRPRVRDANKSAARPTPVRVGLIVNPIAGMGGAVGLKGTDGAATLAEARARGAVPLAAARAGRALAALRELRDRIVIVAANGEMGGDLARGHGFAIETVGEVSGPSTAADTRRAAAAMREAGLALLLFAGGDGTARDVLAGAAGVPLLGIPTGVKMHSAVFAASPAKAGDVARHVLATAPERRRWREGEVMDIDEEALRAGRVAVRLHGTATVPADPAGMQACKQPVGAEDDDELEALARRVARDMTSGCLYVLGCGTTMRRIKRALGGEGTLLGIDVALNGRLIALDVDEQRLTRLISGSEARIIVGVTGGQGYVLGRGNQQLSPTVLKRVGRERITIVAGRRKLGCLDPPCLRVDTGDPETDAMLAGYVRVLTAPGRTSIMRVAA